MMFKRLQKSSLMIYCPVCLAESSVHSHEQIGTIKYNLSRKNYVYVLNMFNSSGLMDY